MRNPPSSLHTPQYVAGTVDVSEPVADLYRLFVRTADGRHRQSLFGFSPDSPVGPAQAIVPVGEKYVVPGGMVPVFGIQPVLGTYVGAVTDNTAISATTSTAHTLAVVGYQDGNKVTIYTPVVLMQDPPVSLAPLYGLSEADRTRTLVPVAEVAPAPDTMYKYVADLYGYAIPDAHRPLQGASFGVGVAYIAADGELYAIGDTAAYADRGVAYAKGTPRKLGGGPWRTVYVRGYTILAVHTDGTAWGSGYMGFGVGFGDTAVWRDFSVLPIGGGWKDLTAGVAATLGLKQDGTIWTCGGNPFGVLGLDIPDGKSTITPMTQIGTSSDWIAIGTGGYSAYAIKRRTP